MDHIKPGLVVAICTSRIDDLSLRFEHNLAEAEGHEIFVVFDGPETDEVAALATRIELSGGTIVIHGRNLGLSPARNTVLAARPLRRVLYIDDDLWLNRAAVAEISAAFDRGANVVGTRLVPPAGAAPWPWYFTTAQMHLVSWHNPQAPIKTWGACMAIDAAFANHRGITFSSHLGRSGTRLESGDDTSFVAAMKAAGALETLLENTTVVHDIDQRRLRIGYLLRRVYWQGRSEVRRGQALHGLQKEWRRHTQVERPRAFLAIPYVAAFCVGIAVEAVRQLRMTPENASTTGIAVSKPDTSQPASID